MNVDIQKRTDDDLLPSTQHKLHTNPDTLAQLESDRALLNLTLSTVAEKQLRWTGAKFYSQKDKKGSKLATKLSPKTRNLAFPKICTTSGDLTQNPARIMATFQDFYSKLYNSNSPSSPHKLETFLKDLPIPEISHS